MLGIVDDAYLHQYRISDSDAKNVVVELGVSSLLRDTPTYHLTGVPELPRRLQEVDHITRLRDRIDTLVVEYVGRRLVMSGSFPNLGHELDVSNDDIYRTVHNVMGIMGARSPTQEDESDNEYATRVGRVTDLYVCWKKWSKETGNGYFIF